MFCEVSWNRVMTMTSPWVAAQDTFCRKPETLKWTVLFDGLNAIYRAGGVIAA